MGKEDNKKGHIKQDQHTDSNCYVISDDAQQTFDPNDNAY